MDKVRDRLKHCLDATGENASVLVDVLGKSQGSISMYLNTDRIPDALEDIPKLAKYFAEKGVKIPGTNDPVVACWLLYGNHCGKSVKANTVPLIPCSWAADWVTDENNHADETVDRVTTDCPVRNHTFAIDVTLDSMEPDIPVGAYVVIEPEIDPRPGDIVLAQIGVNKADVTIKKYAVDGGVRMLIPTNSRYKIREVNDGIIIIGVVREARQHEALIRTFR